MLFQVFDEGLRYIAQHGIPSTAYFLLSTRIAEPDIAPFYRDIGGYHQATDTLAGGVGEVTASATCTGYTRKSQTTPAPTTDDPPQVRFAKISWATGSAADWSSNNISVVLATTADNSGVAICAWDIADPAGTPVNLRAGGSTLDYTPYLVMSG